MIISADQTYKYNKLKGDISKAGLYELFRKSAEEVQMSYPPAEPSHEKIVGKNGLIFEKHTFSGWTIKEISI